MKNKPYPRRKFLLKCLGAATVFFGGASILNSCNSDPDKANHQGNSSSVPKSCDDVTGVSKSEMEKRKKLGYVKESTVPGSHCSNCNFYIPPDSDKKYGGCILFKGPVCSAGYCTQYVAKSKT